MKRFKLSGLVLFLFVFSLAMAACPAPLLITEDDEVGGASSSEDAIAAGLCEDALGCVQVGADAAIEIVVMGAYSGPTASLGDDTKQAIEFVVTEQEEILGHEISLTFEDSMCSTEGGQTAAQKVAANPNVVGVLGPNCSVAAASALPILSEAGLVVISPATSSPLLTNDNPDEGGLWQPGFYRTAHNDRIQGQIAAQFAYNELGARTAATIHDGDPYTDGLQGAFAEAFIELGGEILFQGAVNKGDTDMRPILTEIASNPPDVMYYPLFEPEVNFLTARSVEFPELAETKRFVADAALVDSFPENTGDASIGVYVSGPYLDPEGNYAILLEVWEELYGGVPPAGFHAHAVDATCMLIETLEAIAVDNGDGSLTIGRQAIRNHLNNLTDFEGLTGMLNCDTRGECAAGEALGVYQITNAELNNGSWPPAVVWQPFK